MSGASKARTDAAIEQGPAGPARSMHLTLRAGERLFLNGAVVRVDRKVSLELLNDATFLLENHVMQIEETTTPLRQLYFTAQAMLMDPQNAPASRALFLAMARDLAATLSAPQLRQGVIASVGLVEADRPFQALKALRGMFEDEDALLKRSKTEGEGGVPPAQNGPNAAVLTGGHAPCPAPANHSGAAV